MKFTEIQRKLHQLLNEYEAAVIAENRGRNRSCYNEIENKYYQKRMELKEFVAELEAENDELKERVAMLDVTAVYKSLGEMGYIGQVANLEAENAALQARIAELEAENAMLKQLPQPIEFWSGEKKQIYKINERRTVKSGNEEREE